VETSRRVLDMYINYQIIVQEIKAPCVVHSGDGFYIRAFPLQHTKTCVGYALEELDRPGEFNPEAALALNVPRGPLWARLQAGKTVNNTQGVPVYPEQVLGPKRSGRKFSFVTDTQYFPGIAPEVRGSDLFICEGMLADDVADQAAEKKHMTARQAASIAKAAQVQKLALIHYSPRYSDRELQVLLDEARSVFPDTALTRDRMVFPLPYPDQ
jgi:ribonuclease Z